MKFILQCLRMSVQRSPLLHWLLPSFEPVAGLFLLAGSRVDISCRVLGFTSGSDCNNKPFPAFRKEGEPAELVSTSRHRHLELNLPVTCWLLLLFLLVPTPAAASAAAATPTHCTGHQVIRTISTAKGVLVSAAAACAHVSSQDWPAQAPRRLAEMDSGGRTPERKCAGIWGIRF